VSKQKKKTKKSLDIWQSRFARQAENTVHFWKQYWLSGLIIFLFSTLLYVSTSSFDYVLDDKIVYTENAYTKDGFKGIKKILSTESFEGYFGEQKKLVAGARYRPLSIASFAVEFAALGQSARTSHLINVLLYGLNCLLLFRVFGMLYKQREDIHPLWNVAFIGTMLFAAHPLHVECVANVKGRDEILTLIACLGTMYFAIKYLLKGNIAWLLPLFITFFLGAMTKENTVTFMAILPLLGWYFSKTDIKRIILVAIPGIAATLLYLFIRFQVIGHFLDDSVESVDLMNDPFKGMSFGDKYATIVYTLGLYFKLSFFPHPLTHDYYPYHIPIMNWAKGGTILSLLLYLALSGIAIWGFFKKHIYSFCIVFFLATLSITSNLFFPVGTFMNERFLYVSSVGVVLFLAWLLVRYLPAKLAGKGKFLSIAFFGLLFIGFTAKTIWRTPAWKSKFNLNAYAIKVSKNSARANALMATAIYEDQYLKTDKSERAIREQYVDQATIYVDKALEIHPLYSSALNLKAGLLAEKYNFDRDVNKLLDGFLKLLKVKSNFSYIDQYLEYLNRKNDQDINNALIGFYNNIGTHFSERQGAKPLANKYFRMGLDIAPNNQQLQAGFNRTQ